MHNVDANQRDILCLRIRSGPCVFRNTSNKNTYNNRYIYFSSGSLRHSQQSLLMREFAQGISCLKEQTVTFDQLTLQVSTALLTLIHHRKRTHAGTNSKQPNQLFIQAEAVLLTDLMVLHTASPSLAFN